VSCFDRRCSDEESPLTDVFDNVLWKFQRAGLAKRIHTAYELAHAIIDECSSYFFIYSNTLDKALQFNQLFRRAISYVVSQWLETRGFAPVSMGLGFESRN
jgi:hypothetical protein